MYFSIYVEKLSSTAICVESHLVYSMVMEEKGIYVCNNIVIPLGDGTWSRVTLEFLKTLSISGKRIGGFKYSLVVLIISTTRFE